IFTEHMVRISWTADRGWHGAALIPYAPLTLDPGTSVLHYAQAVFEGLKAFRQGGGGVAAFRPDRHAVRFRNSARRLALPELPEEAFLEAIGGMNLCVVYGRGNQARLMTPALTGTLLPGVTRDSLLTIGSDLGYATEEGRISVDEWRHGCEDGSLTEVFACGTAAVITPVAAVKSARGAWTVGDGGAGEISMRLRRALVDIQRGAAPDPHKWLYHVRVSD